MGKMAAQQLRLLNVSHTVSGRTVLRNINLDLPERRIGIIGRNGSGKSMLIRCLNGLIIPKSGSVMLGDLITAKDAKAVRRHVGMVFQSVEQQLIMPTVHEDVAFGLRSLRRSKPEMKAAVDRILEEFGIAHLSERPVAELSGGEKRLVTLAGVLVMEPDHLLLDEPMTGLDHYQRRQLIERLNDLRQQVIMVSHELEYLAHFDRVIALHEGEIVMDGKPEPTIADWKARYG